MTKSTEPRILFFDLESLPLKARIWQPGKQFVGHKQLLHKFEMWDLICIQYCWNDNKAVKVLRYDKDGGTKGVIEKFDKLIREADHCIGKNSDRFDIKILNSLRMLHNLPGIPEWNKYCDDLEKQMRRYFRLPSQSLDYISRMCGIGGKHSMEMGDWVAIQDSRELKNIQLSGITGKSLKIISMHMFNKIPSVVFREGREALEKMCIYGAKDTEDTRTLWNYLSQHFDAKFNMAVFKGEAHACKTCGSDKIHKNGTRVSGKTKYQAFHCGEHGGYAGRAPISKSGIIGTIG